ncbi:polyprenyl synthetase family protein [Streptomyces sp. NPDC001741]|uniref:polyprenyl synthetase family protein n=1 Tax=Streptomyces sp. NPDC001741 TaxID=3364605 RepID=UPI0036C01097
MSASPSTAWPVSATDARADPTAARTAVDRALEAFLSSKQPSGRPERSGPGTDHLIAVLRAFLSGCGKRVRPLFCHIGWRAATSTPPDVRITNAGVGLELLHGHALVHDDVVDRSLLRRGNPAVPVAYADLRGGDAWHGLSAAVLLGDMAALWAEEHFARLYEPGVPPAARDHLGAMRAELLNGQLLDLVKPSQLFGTVPEAFAVIHAKTVAYTVLGPLLIGAAMAGADPDVTDALAGYARPLREAFQLQDDLEDVTAGPNCPGGGEDLKEGKRTVVVALAAEAATTGQRASMTRLLGRAGMDKLRSTIAATGAVEQVRAMITARRGKALERAANGPFTETGRALLSAMTDVALPGVADWPEVAA